MLNKIILQGRLTKDVEMRTTSNGTKCCSIQIASSRGKNSQGVEETDFLNAIAWSKRAEFISQYFHKGDMILIEGRMQSRNYEDNNGNKRTAYDINISEVNFCGSNAKHNQSQTNVPEAPQTPIAPEAPETPIAPSMDEVDDFSSLPFPI